MGYHGFQGQHRKWLTYFRSWKLDKMTSILQHIQSLVSKITTVVHLGIWPGLLVVSENSLDPKVVKYFRPPSFLSKNKARKYFGTHLVRRLGSAIEQWASGYSFFLLVVNCTICRRSVSLMCPQPTPSLRWSLNRLSMGTKNIAGAVV